MPKLTETAISKAQKDVAVSGKRIDLKDDMQPGLVLRIGQTKMMWTLVCRKPDGATGRFVIGEFPNIGLKKARDETRKQREQIRNGFNPIEQKREARNQKRLIN